MLMTGAISTIQPPKGGIGVPKLAAGALFLFLLFAGFFGTAQRAGADTGIPTSAALEAMAGSAAQLPSGATAEAPPAAGDGAPQAPVDVAQPPTQDAATTQGATADAAAAQPQQSNGLGVTRIDSSGDESASQQNDVAVVGAAANAASTSQAASPGPPSGEGPAAAEAGQQATTDQGADAAAAAAQPQQSNVVIIIRINSPGDDVVSQTNVVSVVAVGANQGSTTQNPAAGASARATSAPETSAPATADPTQSPSSAAPAPLPDAQPGQSSNAGRRLVEHPATVVQQLGPQAPRAFSILTSSASSNALPAAPEFQTAAPTTSVSRPQSGGAAGRSGAFGPGDVATPASSGSSVDSHALPTASTVAHERARQSSSLGRVGALPGRIARWLGRTPAVAGPQLGREDSGRGMNLGLLTLTALLVGLLGWAALTWPPLLRR
jgi:hypothetical protein